MKKNFLLVITAITLICCSDDNSTGDIYVGDVTLRTQEDVNKFGSKKYKKIQGSLDIIDFPVHDSALLEHDYNGVDILDLKPLNSIVEIENKLTILNCDDLTTLNSFENLKSVGTIDISSNTSLTEITGFNNLTFGESVGPYNVIIESNFHLKKILGFNNISSTTNYGISFYLAINQNLENIEGFNAVSNTTLLKSQIFGNNNLSSIVGFNGFSSTYGIGPQSGVSISIEQSPVEILKVYNDLEEDRGTGIKLVGLKLENLNNSFKILNRTSGISIRDNSELENIMGFNNLETTGSLSIMNNPKINSLNGFGKLNRVISDVYIVDNISLTDVESLNTISEINNIHFEGNEQLINYCSILDLLQTLQSNNIFFQYNGYNPTFQEIQNGKCSQ